MANAPVFVGTPLRGILTTANAVTQNVVVGGASGSKIVGMIATSTNTTQQNCAVFIGNATVNNVLTTVSIPANAGTNNSIPPFNIFSPTYLPGLPVDNDGQQYLFLANSTDVISAQTVGTAPGVVIHTIYG